MIYLASPYTAKIHDCIDGVDTPDVIEHKRYIEACMAAGFIMKMGELVYSPIAHWHVIDKLFKGTIGYEDYLAADMQMIELCREVHVLMLDGWEKSRGVQLEIEFAKMKEKPVKYLKMDSMGVHYESLS